MVTCRARRGITNVSLEMWIGGNLGTSWSNSMISRGWLLIKWLKLIVHSAMVNGIESPLLYRI
jgi:hypothetical protein